MRYKLTIGTNKINVWIKSCNKCHTTQSIMFSNGGRVCLECIKKLPVQIYKLPKEMLLFDNKTLIKIIKNKDLDLIPIKMGRIPSSWMVRED